MKYKECGTELTELIVNNKDDILKLLTKKWIKLECSKAEVYPEVLWKNESWNEVKDKIPTGCRIPTTKEADEIDYLQIIDTKSGNNDFFIKQPFRRNRAVARFYAISDRAGLNCNRDPGVLYHSFGLVLVRDLKVGK